MDTTVYPFSHYKVKCVNDHRIAITKHNSSVTLANIKKMNFKISICYGTPKEQQKDDENRDAGSFQSRFPFCKTSLN